MPYESPHAIATHSGWKCQAQSKEINVGNFSKASALLVLERAVKVSRHWHFHTWSFAQTVALVTVLNKKELNGSSELQRVM